MWALVENRCVVFQVAVGALFSVHGDGSAHVVTNSRMVRANFHHLTGHYPSVGSVEVASAFRGGRKLNIPSWQRRLAG